MVTYRCRIYYLKCRHCGASLSKPKLRCQFSKSAVIVHEEAVDDMSTIGMLSMPVGPSSAAAWPLSLQLTRWPVVHAGKCSSAAAWPLSPQLIRWPVGPSSVVAWPISLQLTRWPVGLSSVVAWPLSLQLTRWPVGPSSVVAWPLSLQLTRWPVGHVFAAEVIAFVRQYEQRA